MRATRHRNRHLHWRDPFGRREHRLAQRHGPCLTGRTVLQFGRTFGGSGRRLRAAVAGLLVFLLLIVMTLSANHSLHQALHHGSAADGHFCLVCFFAKGQVSIAPVALVSAVLVFYRLGGVCLANAPAFSGFDYRLSPSRAPPRS